MSNFPVRDRRMSPGYEICRAIVWAGVRFLYKVRITGKENVPLNGPVVIGSNHIHNFDPLVIGAHCPRYIHFMAKEELFKGSLLTRFLRYIGAFPIRRGQGDKGAMRHAIAVPANGQCLLVFPEGHRSKDGTVGTGMPGIALIARKSKCPVVPVAVIGSYKFRRNLSVRYGEPFLPKENDTNEAFMETLMERIRELHAQGLIE